MNMIRKQFFIDAGLNRQLKALAAQTGKSEGEVIRAGIDALINVEAADEASWRRGLERLSGV